jgi:hypothetical protein
MSAARQVLDRLAAIGATVECTGARLVLRAGAVAVPADVIAALREHKADLLELLSSPKTTSASVPIWNASDWRHFYGERAAIRQYDGGYSRAEAESLAWGEVVNEWHFRHGDRIPTSRCAGCGNLISGTAALELPDGCRVHVVNGFDCLTRYSAKWLRAAERALVEMGLMPPVGP